MPLAAAKHTPPLVFDPVTVEAACRALLADSAGTLGDGKHERLKARRTGSQAFEETRDGVSLEG
jgi:hypothetical protein